MKCKTLLTLAILAGISSSTWACFSNPGNPSNPGGGVGEPSPDCTVSWDFTGDRPADQQTGDPLTYTSLSDPDGDEYTLIVRGFAVNRRDENGDNDPASATNELGAIVDNGGTYATDQDGNDYAMGVHAPGESDHWGTKIDNVRNGDDHWYRDAVLMEFENCVVSMDEISLLQAYGGADTDFELWAYNGDAGDLDFSGNDVSTQIANYEDWSTLWTQIEENDGNPNDGDRTVQVSNAVQSSYFILIAGTEYNEWDDAFRLSSLTVSCEAGNCGGPGDPVPPSSVPLPGTLLLVGIGALATRRRVLKLS